MTIDEAIEMLKEKRESEDCSLINGYAHALKLGIEALKRCKKAYETGKFMPVYPLEGEEVSGEEVIT